jgi:hypothetical protein
MWRGWTEKHNADAYDAYLSGWKWPLPPESCQKS